MTPHVPMVPVPSRLGQKLSAGVASPQASPASSVSALRRSVASGRRGEEVTLPVIGRVYLELPGARAWQEIEAAVRKELRRLEVGELSIQTAAAHEAELALRVLAAAAKDPDEHSVAFGSLEEWGDLDNDVINLAWHAFGDVRERLDPVSLPLSGEDMIAIGIAVKKKDQALLRSYGAARLSAWLATTDDPPSTLLIPSSPNSDSPTEP